MIPLLLPHLDAFDNHLSIILPCRVPVPLCVPEITSCGWTLINPRLPAQSVLEPAIGTANRNVQDEIEVLVKGRRVIACLTPWVDQPRSIRVGQREIPPLPEWLVEVCVQDLQQAGVDVRKEVLLTPLKAEGVEGLAEGGVQSVALDVGPPPRVVCTVRSPVQR